MNMLLDSLPTSLLIGGREYEINTDFRVWIKYEQLLTGQTKSDDVFKDVLNLVFPVIPPQTLFEEMVDKLVWFYQCGKDNASVNGNNSAPVFSYDYDASYICAAFREQYNVDIDIEKMHWWKFHALMMSLNENTEFVKIMGYRAVKINSKMSAEQRNFYTKMKKRFAIPMNSELKKQYTDIENALINGEDIDSLL